ncbi:MAG: hypothetical protein WCP96_12960 [Methylococcaceae bacterium]
MRRKRNHALRLGGLIPAYTSINLTWDRPDRFYKPVRSNVGIFVLTKVGSLLLNSDKDFERIATVATPLKLYLA